jgi:hypothetical protein
MNKTKMKRKKIVATHIIWILWRIKTEAEKRNINFLYCPQTMWFSPKMIFSESKKVRKLIKWSIENCDKDHKLKFFRRFPVLNGEPEPLTSNENKKNLEYIKSNWQRKKPIFIEDQILPDQSSFV